MSAELEAAKRKETRYQILTLLDQARPNEIGETVLGRSLAEAHLPIGRDALRNELDYLKDKGLIAVATSPQNWRASLMAAGVDVLEHSITPPPGIVLPDRSYGDTEIHRRHEIRWRILATLNAGRPIPVAENLVWRTLDDAQLLVTPTELRRAAVYLEQKGLITLNTRNQSAWTLDLTATGVDVVEYTIEAPPGIGRTEKYW